MPIERPFVDDPMAICRARDRSSDLSAILAYLQRVFMSAREERLHVVYCDSLGGFLHDRTVASGEAGGLRMRSRGLLQEAFDVGASALILAHNHPSGICRPSAADIDSTLRLARLCREVDIDLLDHFILTRSRAFSMRRGGYL